jgi:hypothetical protein
MAYAENTSVPVSKSKAEIEQIIHRFGADGLVSGWQGDKHAIEFLARGRRVRFVLEVPNDRSEFALTEANRRRTPAQAQAAMEQEQRRRWRSLALVVKAKLEAVESGIVTFENEFLAQIVLPNGGTVGDQIAPAIAEAYDKGRVSGNLLMIEGAR